MNYNLSAVFCSKLFVARNTHDMVEGVEVWFPRGVLGFIAASRCGSAQRMWVRPTEEDEIMPIGVNPERSQCVVGNARLNFRSFEPRCLTWWDLDTNL